MSKAFDRVDNNLLLAELKYIGLPPLFLKWMSSYILNPQQQVTVLGATSKPLTVVPESHKVRYSAHFYSWFIAMTFCPHVLGVPCMQMI